MSIRCHEKRWYRVHTPFTGTIPVKGFLSYGKPADIMRGSESLCFEYLVSFYKNINGTARNIFKA